MVTRPGITVFWDSVVHIVVCRAQGVLSGALGTRHPGTAALLLIFMYEF